MYRCICRECAVENLAGALEHRSCREIAQASQELMFHGSIERVSCITQHDDFSSMTNRSVLLQVGPLLRDKSGRGYRRRDGQTESQQVAFKIRFVMYLSSCTGFKGYLRSQGHLGLTLCSTRHNLLNAILIHKHIN